MQKCFALQAQLQGRLLVCLPGQRITVADNTLEDLPFGLNVAQDIFQAK